MSLLFVYGTLKRGCRNHAFLSGQSFVGEAQTAPGFRLFDLGEYPGMIRHGNDRTGVAGEVWSVDPACLARLDVLEGVAEKLYERASVPLQGTFSNQDVESYLYLRPVTDRRDVGSVWHE